MEKEEHSRRVREEVVEKFNAGLGHTISQALSISEYGTSLNLPRYAHQHKLT